MSYSRNYIREAFFKEARIKRERLPVEGTESHIVNGLRMWVAAVGETNFHRHLVICPDCQKCVSFGRLAQHRKIHKK